MSKKHSIGERKNARPRRFHPVKNLAKYTLIVSAAIAASLLILPYIAPDLVRRLSDGLTAFAGQRAGFLDVIAGQGATVVRLLSLLLVLGMTATFMPKALRGGAPQVYRHSLIYHPVLRKVLLTSISVAAVTAAIWVWPHVNSRSATWLAEKFSIPPRTQPHFDIIAGLLIGQAILVALLVFPVWFSPMFRSLAWVMARTLGSVLRWLRTDWRLPILLIGGLALALYVRVRLLQHYGRAGDEYHEVDFLLGEYFLKAMVVAALLILVYWAYQARTRIIITAFEDSTQDPLLNGCAMSIHSQLLSELSRLYKLYNVIDEASPTNIEQGEIINAAVTVESLSQDLAKAVTPDSKLDMGFIKIPIGSIMGVIGRVVQGPRITGSLHKEGDKPILLASLNGGGLKGSWRVDFSKLSEHESSDVIRAIERARRELKDSAQSDAIKQNLIKAIGRMTNQLACRIFTEIANPGSPRWLAVAEYTHGLRVYRDTLRTKQDRDLKLRQAEKSFISALSHDNKFAYNHYNLSIVYREMKRPLAARAALMLAIREAPNLCKAYYALALSEWDTALSEWNRAPSETGAARKRIKENVLKRYEEIIELCDRMIALDPDEPLSWNLKSLAHRKIWRCKEDETAALPNSAIHCGEVATALAWRDLCLLALKGKKAEQLKESRDIARTCARNLAATYRYAGSGNPRTLFRQAIRISDTDDPETYFDWGKAHKHTGDFAEAAKAFRTAARLSGQSIYWAYLASAEAHLFKSSRDKKSHRNEAEDACYLALGTLQEEENVVKELIQEAWGIIFNEKAAKESRRERPENIIEFFESIERRKKGETSKEYIIRLQKIRKEWEGKGWERGWLRTALSLAKEYLYASPELAEECLRSDEGNGDVTADDAKARLVSRAREWLKKIIRLAEEIPDGFHVLQAQGLHAHIARAYLQQRSPAEALYHAERAVTLNPERCWERSVLGEVYWTLNNYERAEAEYNTALNLDPGAATLKNIARNYWSKGNILRDREERRGAFLRVIDTLTRALDLAESKPFDLSETKRQVETCGWIHYWLGRFNYELRQYDKAISHLRIVRAIDFKPLECRVQLGLVYMEAGAFNEAEEALHSFEEEVEKLNLDSDSISKPGPGMAEDRNIAELSANAYHYWTISLIKRGVNLDKAEEKLRNAQCVVKQLEGPTKQECEGINLLCEGWILMERRQEDKLEEAIKILENSIDHWADARTYYHLARGYFRRSEVSASVKAFGAAAGGGMPPPTGMIGWTDADVSAWLDKARNYCALARDNDLRGQLDEEIGNLIELIDARRLAKA